MKSERLIGAEIDHIQYSKGVLGFSEMSDLKSLCVQHVREIPAYNFMRKTEEPSNYLEKIIRDLIGKDNHTEYWVRNSLEKTLFHVDANELQSKYDAIKHGGFDPDQKLEFPLNTHVLYVSIDTRMEGGELFILPYTTYIKGRPILDTTFIPLENSPMITIKPVENHLVMWDKPIYHATGIVRNQDIVKYRISLMFSSWDYIPKIYCEHEHWSNYNPAHLEQRKNSIPKPMEFNLK